MNLVSPVTATLLCASWVLAAGTPRSAGVQTQVRTPIAFEPNVGQAAPEVRWISRTPDRTFLLTRDEARMLLRTDGSVAAVGMKLIGAKAGEATGLDPLPSTSSYLVGNNSKDWRSGVPHYGRVRYRDVYKGIDVVYYSSDRQLEYDFVLAPGADASAIELAYEGAGSIRLDSNGDLVIDVAGRTLRQLRPKVYQMANGSRQEIAASYRLRKGNRVQFSVAGYDRSRELVIDPVLQYSTYFGDEGYDSGAGMATDQNGDIYMTGATTSVRHPAALAAQDRFAGDTDAFVAKFSSSGSLVWLTYLGGSKTDSGRDIAVDATGNAYVVGATLSANFPVRSAPYAESAGDYDGFLAKISSDGRQFLFSTYLGGSSYDEAMGVALGAAGDAYVTGQTTSFDFPVRNGFQRGAAGGGGDIFVTKFSTTRNVVVYSTYVGGNGIDTATGIAVDSDGSAYVTGGTTSTVFPVFAPIQGVLRGDWDAFLFKLNSTGTSLEYSTLLGGSLEDFSYRVALDSQRAAYLLGYTKSTDFPVRGALQSRPGGVYDAFVTKINPAGNAIEYSTYLGGSLDDFGLGGIAVDVGGSAYVSGYTASPDFPIRSQFQSTYGGGRYDAFVARLSPQGNSLLYSSLLGGAGDDYAFGVALDRQSHLTVAGKTTSANFPSARNAFVGNKEGEYDVFLSRISPDTSVNFVTPSQSALTFVVRPGVVPAPQTLSLGASGTALNVTAQSNQSWLRATVDRNTTPATLTVSVDPSGLPASPSLTGSITINAPSAGNTPFTIQVTVSQTVVPVIVSAAPGSLTREASNATVTLTGSGFQTGVTVRLNGSTQSTLIDGNTIQVIVPAAVRASAERLTFVVVNPDGAQSNEFVVPISAGPSAITVTAAGIVNSASNVAGAIAPGEIIVVSGTGFGPGELVNGAVVSGALAATAGGVRVLVDNIPAPILYAGQNQVGAIVPYAIAGRTSALLEVEWQGQRSAPVRLDVASVAPGLFTANSSGVGQASAVNQDGSRNSESNPAAAGSVISLYATGEGMLSPAGGEGRIVTTERPVLPVNVLVNGVSVTPEYAGGSPGSPAGLLQINVRIPAGVSGSSVPVQLNAGGLLSQPGVTIAVR